MGSATALGYTCGCDVARIGVGGCLFGARAGAERVSGPLKTAMCTRLSTAFDEQQESAVMQARAL